ncbi:MAG: hypothetical protein AAGC46_19285 [Solirubrobacteraceae bacterium]|nr:hypothetical protein [Patulibacter sp.]
MGEIRETAADRVHRLYVEIAQRNGHSLPLAPEVDALNAAIIGQGDGLPTAGEALRSAVAFLRGAQRPDAANGYGHADLSLRTAQGWTAVARELRESRQQQEALDFRRDELKLSVRITEIREVELARSSAATEETANQNARVADAIREQADAQIAAANAVERANDVEAFVRGLREPQTETESFARNVSEAAEREQDRQAAKHPPVDDTQQFAVPGHPDAAPVIAEELKLADRCLNCGEETCTRTVGSEEGSPVSHIPVHRNTGWRVCQVTESDVRRSKTYATVSAGPCERCKAAQHLGTVEVPRIDGGEDLIVDRVHTVEGTAYCPNPRT